MNQLGTNRVEQPLIGKGVFMQIMKTLRLSLPDVWL